MQINRWFAEHSEPGISISDKVRLGRATIGLALRGTTGGWPAICRCCACRRNSATRIWKRCWSRSSTGSSSRTPWCANSSTSSTTVSDRPGPTRYSAWSSWRERAARPLAWSHDPPYPPHRTRRRVPGLLPAAAAGPTSLVRMAVPKYIVGAVTLLRDSEASGAGRLLLLRQRRAGDGPCRRVAATRREPGRRCRPGVVRGDRGPALPHPTHPGGTNAIVHAKGWVDVVFTAEVPASRTELTVDGAEVFEAAWHRWTTCRS